MLAASAGATARIRGTGKRLRNWPESRRSVMTERAMLWNNSVIGLSCNLKRKLQGQLPHTSVYSCAADDAERGRCEVCIGVRKLGMVQCIIELSPKLETAFFDGPLKDYRL
jgi:hypothetical protein